MTQMDYGVLELNADVDKDGEREQGVFYFVGNLEIEHIVEIDHLVGGKGSTVNAIVTSRTEASPKRAGYHLDMGGGRHSFRINFTGWQGAREAVENKAEVDEYRWGDGSGELPADATGADVTTQEQVLSEYIRAGEYDSRAEHAKFRWGQFRDGTYHDSDGALDDYIHVTIPESRLRRTSENPVAFNGNITLVETEDWRDVIDAFGKLQI